MTHHPPELEAVELNGAWYVRTKPEIGTPEIVADLSMARHGKEWATLFAKSRRLLQALKILRAAMACYEGTPEEILALDEAEKTIAAAEGRAEQ